MRVIIAGSRTITDYEIVNRVVSHFHSEQQITEVVSGTAQGVDQLGERWANENNINVVRFPANWQLYGKSAGPIRNKKMAEYADAGIVIIENSSRGSANMLDQLFLEQKQSVCVEVWDYTYEQYEKDIEKITQRVFVGPHEYAAIFAPVRGGLIPGVHLSHKLKIPFFSLDVKKDQYGEIDVSGIINFIQEGKKVLVVEDIIDGGSTVASILDNVDSSIRGQNWVSETFDQIKHNAHVASLIYNQALTYKPEYHGLTIDRLGDKRWIRFWWEK